MACLLKNALVSSETFCNLESMSFPQLMRHLTRQWVELVITLSLKLPLIVIMGTTSALVKTWL
jgi:hypothetical protein